MKKETLKALKGSIKKWEEVVAGTGGDDGAENCPLCELQDEGKGCRECPVMRRVHDYGCRGTPYEKWVNYVFHERFQPYPMMVVTIKALSLALNELYFLKSLLPKKRKTKKVTDNGAL